MNEFLESQEFYELMQDYRNAPFIDQDRTLKAFEAVKKAIQIAGVKPANEYTPIVAHVVIKSKVTELLLENLCRNWGNEMYIDFTQSLTSYKNL